MTHIPWVNVDEMVNESGGQPSTSVRSPDEDGVYDVEGVVLLASSPWDWPTFPLEAAEADWDSLHPAQQDLTTMPM